MVVGKLGDFVSVARSDGRSIDAVEVLPRRSGGVRISVVESGGIGRKNRGVRAFLLGEPGQAGPVKSNAVEVSFQRRFFRGGEIHETFFFIHGVERSDFPFTSVDLRTWFPLEGHVLELPE